MIVFTYLYSIFINKNKSIKLISKKVKSITIEDIISLSLALLVLLVIVLPPIFKYNNKFRFENFLISNISNTSDDAAHIGYINDHIQFDRGVFYKSDAEKLTRGNSFYPTSWSSTNAIIIKSINPKIIPGEQTILAYVLIKLFWIFIISYLVTRISFIIFKMVNIKKNRILEVIEITLISIICNILLIIPLSISGSFSFFPQIISVLFLSPILFQLSIDKNNEMFSLILLFCIGGCLAWFLPLPAFFIIIITSFIYSIFRQKKNLISNSILLIKKNAPLIIIVYSAIINQLLIMTSNKSIGSVSFINGIVIPGYKITYSNFFNIFICIGAIAFYLLINKKFSKRLFPIIFTVASICSYCVIILTLQFSINGSSSYYYFKLLDLFVFTVLPICIAGYALIIEKISVKKSVIETFLISLIFVTISWQIIGNDNGGIIYYAAGNRVITNKISRTVLDELSNRVSISNYSNKEYSFVYTTPNNPIQNKHSSGIIKTNKPLSNCYNVILNNIYDSTPLDKIIDASNKYCKNYKIYILTNKTSYSGFVDIVKTKKASNFIIESRF